MPQRLKYQCPCSEKNHRLFDSVRRRELSLPINSNQILNQSSFCIPIQRDLISATEGELQLTDHLAGLQKKVGLYHIWVEADYCHDHDKHLMLGVYVGKGEALGRVLQHVRKKLPDDELFSISFFECENRVAKYLEQLFLDIYKFHINTNENVGTLGKGLYTCWKHERRVLGTELHNISNRPNAPTGD